MCNEVRTLIVVTIRRSVGVPQSERPNAVDILDTSEKYVVAVVTRAGAMTELRGGFEGIASRHGAPGRSVRQSPILPSRAVVAVGER